MTSDARGLTDLPGVRVGHWTHATARTGCTVVLLPDEGCVASGSVAGPAPGSRESALLAPERTVQTVHALLLAGGSAFGLDAASGVMAHLEARGVGMAVAGVRVPIVPAAVLFDLGVGDAGVRPGAEAGRAACEAAHDGPVVEGAVGAGTGATIDKLGGFEAATPSGLGSAARSVAGATVAALAVSNAVGTLVDPQNGRALAGRADPDPEALAAGSPPGGAHTTLVVVGTDAPLDKAAARALSHAGHAGIARVTRPSHTSMDGDTCFTVTVGGGPEVPLAALGVAVQEVVATALLRGTRAAWTWD